MKKYLKRRLHCTCTRESLAALLRDVPRTTSSGWTAGPESQQRPGQTKAGPGAQSQDGPRPKWWWSASAFSAGAQAKRRRMTVSPALILPAGPPRRTGSDGPDGHETDMKNLFISLLDPGRQPADFSLADRAARPAVN